LIGAKPQAAGVFGGYANEKAGGAAKTGPALFGTAPGGQAPKFFVYLPQYESSARILGFVVN
jgi:hypothetical protein